MKIIDGKLEGVTFEEARWIGGRIEPSIVVLHDTASRLEPGAAEDYLRDNDRKVSVHFIIARDGKITQRVPVNRRANHAGTSEYHGRAHCNGFSIGIELVNPGRMTRASATHAMAWYGTLFDIAEFGIQEVATPEHGHGLWMPCAPVQISALIDLLTALFDGITGLQDITTHWYVSPGREVDTNPLFPLGHIRSLIFGREDPLDIAAEAGSEQVGGGEFVQVNTPGDTLNMRRWPSFNPNVIVATTDDIRLDEVDLATPLANRIDTAFERHDAAVADAEGAIAELRDLALSAYGPLFNVQTPLAERLAPLIPAQVDLEDRLDQVAQSVGWGLTQILRIEQKFSDAGIFLDPATGQIRISAVEALDQRYFEVEITLDAALSAIESSATVAYVNQTISDALLDPTQIPIIGDLQVQVTEASTRIDGLEASVISKASVTSVEGITVRITTAEEDIDALQTQITDMVTAQEFSAAEDRLSEAEQTLDALDGPSITQTVTDQRRVFDELDTLAEATLGQLLQGFQDRQALSQALAFAQSEIYAKVGDDLSAEAGARLALQAQVEDAQALLQSEQTVRADADEALAEDVTQLQTALTTAQGDIGGNASVLASLSGTVTTQGQTITAQGQDLTALTAAVGQNSGAISDLSVTRVTAAGAVAAVDQQISASYGSLTALAEATAFAEATASGINLGFAFRLNGQGVLEMFLISDGVGGQRVTAEFDTDYFRIRGLTQIDEAVIADLAVSDALIDNLQVGSLSAISGSIGQFKSAPSGERIEIEDDKITIFDANDVVRVKIGNLA